MKCMGCEREFKQTDKVIVYHRVGLFHEDDCFEEYIFSTIVSSAVEFKDLSEETLKHHFDDGEYDSDPNFKMPTVIRERKVESKGIN